MDDQDPTPTRRWVAAWKKAGPELERIRREELLRVDVARALESLEDAFLCALRDSPPKPSSGLVEQQRLFGRLRT